MKALVSQYDVSYVNKAYHSFCLTNSITLSPWWLLSVWAVRSKVWTHPYLSSPRPHWLLQTDRRGFACVCLKQIPFCSCMKCSSVQTLGLMSHQRCYHKQKWLTYYHKIPLQCVPHCLLFLLFWLYFYIIRRPKMWILAISGSDEFTVFDGELDIVV